MGWLIALAVIVLLMCLPVGVSARFDENGSVADLIAGPVRLRLYPAKKKKSKKADDVKKPAQDTKKKSGSGNKKGGSYTDFLPVLKVVLELLEAFRRKLRVRNLEFQLILANSDPADLALNYTKAWAAVGNLMPQLERFLTIKNRDIRVQCDFTAEKTLVYAAVELTITLGGLLWLVLWHGGRVFYHYFKILNQRKGGAKT